jgi:hypothetical protein
MNRRSVALPNSSGRRNEELGLISTYYCIEIVDVWLFAKTGKLNRAVLKILNRFRCMFRSFVKTNNDFMMADFQR